MSAQEHTFTFCQIFFISGGNYTLITCIQYTTMVTHSECEISQYWRTQFSSHGALNLNRAVMPPLPLYDFLSKSRVTTKNIYVTVDCVLLVLDLRQYVIVDLGPKLVRGVSSVVVSRVECYRASRGCPEDGAVRS